MSEVDEVSDAAHPQSPRRPPRRRAAAVAAAVVAAGLLAGGGWFVATSVSEASADTSIEKAKPATEEVERGTLEGTATATGTLRYSDPRSLHSGLSGTLTATAAPGSVVGLGGHLYSVDNKPVFLLHGGLPAWRSFDGDMENGPDVLQLETSLRGLGFFTEEPDDDFSWATYDAIKRWQKANGLEQTGELPLGSVVFSAVDLRIGELVAAVGDQVGSGADLFGISGTTQVVEMNVDLVDQKLAVVGAAVNVRLPGGESTMGTISSVGTPTEVEDSQGQKKTVVPVVVTLDDSAAAAGLQEASVSVDIPSEKREDVLSVPVGALLALTPEEFGVEVVESDGTTHKVPVTTGLFAGGRVEISGDGIEAGIRVVVPKR